MANVRAKVAARPAPAPAPEPAPAAVAYDSPVVAREIARPVMPTIPGRAVALNRAGKPVQRAAAETGVNEFYIPPHLPPQGWSWEWKEETVLGEVRQGYAAKLALVGWEPVMYESYPGTFGPEFDDQGKPRKGPVRRGGLMLMERAMTLTMEAVIEEKRKADQKMGDANRQYSRVDTRGSTTAEFDLTAQRTSYIKQTVEAAPPLPNGGPARQPID